MITNFTDYEKLKNNIYGQKLFCAITFSSQHEESISRLMTAVILFQIGLRIAKQLRNRNAVRH